MLNHSMTFENKLYFNFSYKISHQNFGWPSSNRRTNILQNCWYNWWLKGWNCLPIYSPVAKSDITPCNVIFCRGTAGLGRAPSLLSQNQYRLTRLDGVFCRNSSINESIGRLSVKMAWVPKVGNGNMFFCEDLYLFLVFVNSLLHL